MGRYGYGWRPQRPDWRDPDAVVMAPSHILPRPTPKNALHAQS